MLIQTVPLSILNSTSVWHYVWNIHLEGLCMNFSYLVWWDCISLPALQCSVRAPHPHSSLKHFTSYALFMCGFAFSLQNGTLGIVGELFHFISGLPGSELMMLMMAYLYSTYILYLLYITFFYQGREGRSCKVMSWTLNEECTRSSLACANRKSMLSFFSCPHFSHVFFLCSSLWFPVYLESCVWIYRKPLHSVRRSHMYS